MRSMSVKTARTWSSLSSQQCLELRTQPYPDQAVETMTVQRRYERYLYLNNFKATFFCLHLNLLLIMDFQIDRSWRFEMRGQFSKMHSWFIWQIVYYSANLQLQNTRMLKLVKFDRMDISKNYTLILMNMKTLNCWSVPTGGKQHSKHCQGFFVLFKNLA